MYHILKVCFREHPGFYDNPRLVHYSELFFQERSSEVHKIYMSTAACMCHFTKREGDKEYSISALAFSRIPPSLRETLEFTIKVTEGC